MQTRTRGPFSGLKTGFQRFIGLGLLSCGLMFPALSARSQSFGGLITYAGIDFKGNQVTVDGFNSSDPDHSIWQTNWLRHGHPYGIWSSSLSFDSNIIPCRTDNATVATDGSIIDLGNANIAGYVATGLGGTISIGANGSVGDLYWAFHSTGIQPGHSYDGVNRTFYSYSLPDPMTTAQTTWWPVPAISTNIGGVTYSYLITNKPANSNLVYYAMSSLTSSIFIDASNVVLYLTNGLTYSSTQKFTLNTNADVQLWSAGDISARPGAINNLTQNAHAFAICDVSGHPIEITFGGSGVGVGFIYAPSSDVKFAGGGAATYDVVGVIFCNSIQINGNYNFHMDESMVAPLPPLIFSQPTNQIVPLGSNAEFSVSVIGIAPVRYTWFFNQTNLLSSGTNKTSLSLTNVQFSDAGSYFVIVTNLYGSVTSAPASLIVYTDATPTLSALLITNSQFQCYITGVTGLNYIVQGSSNLMDWIPLGTNLSPFTFVDTNTALFPQRFYRSVYLP